VLGEVLKTHHRKKINRVVKYCKKPWDYLLRIGTGGGFHKMLEISLVV
jgi:hypothetical protein